MRRRWRRGGGTGAVAEGPRSSGASVPAVIPPAGYVIDHWVTSAGALFDFGTVTQDVTVHPVYVMDYTVTNLPTEIIIATPNDFTNLMSAHSGDDFDGITIKLMCDVSTAVGFSNSNPGFKGIFDGNGKTVTVNLTEYAFIAKNTGTIKNLVISGQIVNTSSNYTGGFVGENAGTIENCGCIIGMGASSCTISNVYCDGNSGCSNSEDLATANENVTNNGLVDNSIWEAGSDSKPRLINVPGQ